MDAGAIRLSPAALFCLDGICARNASLMRRECVVWQRRNFQFSRLQEEMCYYAQRDPLHLPPLSVHSVRERSWSKAILVGKEDSSSPAALSCITYHAPSIKHHVDDVLWSFDSVLTTLKGAHDDESDEPDESR